MVRAARRAAWQRRVVVTAGAWALASVALSPIAHSQPPDGGSKPARVITLSTGYGGARTDMLMGRYASEFRRLRPALRACYERALGHHPTARGTLRLVAPVGPSGRLMDVRGPVSHTLPTGLMDCLRARLTAVAFPPPEGGTATVRQDVVFLPRLAAEHAGANAASSIESTFEADWTVDTAPRMPVAVVGHGGEPTSMLIRALQARVVHCTNVPTPLQSVRLAFLALPDGTTRDVQVVVTPEHERAAACIARGISSASVPRSAERAQFVTLRFTIRNGGAFLVRE